MTRSARFGLGLAALLASPAAGQEDIAYGRHLASECVTCHQADGDVAGIPAIVGWPPETFVAAMRDYRSGKRRHDVMAMIAGRYDDAALAALAAYFETLGGGDTEG